MYLIGIFMRNKSR